MAAVEDCAQLGEMRAASRAGQQAGGITAKVAEQVEPDEGAVGGIGGFTQTRIRHPVGRRFCVDDIELAIDRDAEPEFMDRQAVRPDTRRKHHVTWLFVGEARLDIPQAIFTLVCVHSDCAAMAQLSGHWRGKRHARKKAGLKNR
jgi:hypothetical protein